MGDEEHPSHKLFLTQGREGLVLSDKGIIVAGNKTISGLMGFDSPQDIIGLSVMDFVPDNCKEDVLHKIRSGYDKPYDTELLDRNGKIIPISTDGKMVEYNDTMMRLTSIIEITERKKAETENVILHEQVQHLQRLEILGLMVGGIAHDFRNVLTGLNVGMELIRGEIYGDNSTFEHMQEIIKTSERLIGNLQSFVSERGTETTLIRLKDFIHSQSALLKILISKSHTLEMNIKDCVLNINDTHLQQVLLNAVINASEAIGDNPGSIIIDVEELYYSKIQLEQYLNGENLIEGKYIVIKIIDSGKQIDEISKSKLFTPFFTSKGKGRGLGLGVIKGIILTYNGGIRVTQNMRKSFEFIFPTAF